MRKINTLLIIIITGLIVYNYFPEKSLSASAKIDRLVVLKSKRQLLAYENGTVIKTYKISLGRNPKGAKEFEGDMKTPEGVYAINNKNPNSGYYKNLGVSYPNKEDKDHAAQNGKLAGGDIKIHGLRNGLGFINKFHRFFDWTHGCIALTDKEVEELYSHVSVGTPIEIKP